MSPYFRFSEHSFGRRVLVFGRMAADGWRRHWGVVGTLLAVGTLVGGCATSRRPPSVAWHTTAIGLCEDYPEETRTLARARRDLALAHDAGVRVLRVGFGWDSMEPERGRYDWSFWDDFVRLAVDTYGIRLIPYVCYTPKWAAVDQGENYWRSPPRDPEDFGRFLTALARRYHDRIDSWELWNEPDNQAYWLGTPEQFAALIEAGSAALRRSEPHAQIVLGGIAGEVDFLARLLRDPRVGRAVDVLDFHSYFETWHPSPIERVPQYLATIAALDEAAGGRHALWMAETGYSSVGARRETSSAYRTHFRNEHTDRAQAAALLRTGLSALGTEQLSALAWYRINDLVAAGEVIGDDNNRHLGVARVDGSPKPALGALRWLANRFVEPYAVIKPPVVVGNVEPAGAAPVVYAFTLRHGRTIVAAWLPMADVAVSRELAEDQRHVTLTVQVPSHQARSVRVRDELGDIALTGIAARQTRDGADVTCVLHGGEVRIVEFGP